MGLELLDSLGKPLKGSRCPAGPAHSHGDEIPHISEHRQFPGDLILGSEKLLDNNSSSCFFGCVCRDFIPWLGVAGNASCPTATLTGKKIRLSVAISKSVLPFFFFSFFYLKDFRISISVFRELYSCSPHLYSLLLLNMDVNYGDHSFSSPSKLCLIRFPCFVTCLRG